MIAAGSLEYAHARIWARHGQRPDGALWRRSETTREFAAVLELARGSALAGWLEGIAPGAGVHAVEAALRRHWRERVAEVASWMPAAWQPAIAWCGVLVDLPALQHLARGGAPADWMASDQRLCALLDGTAPEGAELRAALREDCELATALYPRVLVAVERRLRATRMQMLDLFATEQVKEW